MAIKIHKKVEKVEEEKSQQVLEPEVLPPENSQSDDGMAPESSMLPGIGTMKAPEMNDKFMMRSSNAMAWLMENRRMVILAVTAVLVIALSFIMFQKYNESVATNDSSELMSDVFISYSALTEEEAKLINEQMEAYFKSQGIAAQSENILKHTITVPNDRIRHLGIQKYLNETLATKKFANLPIEKTGYLMLAGSTARTNTPAEAGAIYSNLMDTENSDIKLFSMLGSAEMLVGQQKYDEAIALYDKIAVVNAAFTSFARFEKAHLYEIEGKVKEAIEVYDLILRESGDVKSQERAMAQLRFLTPDWATHAPAQKTAPEQQAAL